MSLVNSGLMARIASVETRFSSPAFVFTVPFDLADLGPDCTRRGGGSSSEGETSREDPARDAFDVDLVAPYNVVWCKFFFSVLSAGISTVNDEHYLEDVRRGW